MARTYEEKEKIERKERKKQKIQIQTVNTEKLPLTPSYKKLFFKIVVRFTPYFDFSYL